jgi:hypothetical protein
MYSACGSRKFLSSTYRQWVSTASAILKSQLKDIKGLPLKDGFQLIVYIPQWDKRVKDSSNYIKSAEDLLVRCGVMLDDRYLNGTSSQWVEPRDWEAMIAKGKYDDYIKAIVVLAEKDREKIDDLLTFLDP